MPTRVRDVGFTRDGTYLRGLDAAERAELLRLARAGHLPPDHDMWAMPERGEWRRIEPGDVDWTGGEP